MSLSNNTSKYIKDLVFGMKSEEEKKQVEEVLSFDSEVFERKVGKKEIFFEKQSLSRPDRRSMNPRSSRTLTTIGIVLGVLLLIMQQFTLLIAIGSIIFISHALAKATPDTVKYEISNYGIKYAQSMYYWPQLKSFYFGDKEGMPVLAVNTMNSLPGRLFLFCDKEDITKLRAYMEEKLPMLEKEPETFLDQAYNSISNKFDI